MNDLILLATLFVGYLLPNAPRPSERVQINDNRKPAGLLRSGVLSLHLEARAATWHPDADDGPGVAVQAFAERGRSPQIPGPLIRVPAGTVVDVTMRNAIAKTTLVVYGLSSRPATHSRYVSRRRVPARSCITLTSMRHTSNVQVSPACSWFSNPKTVMIRSTTSRS